MVEGSAMKICLHLFSKYNRIKVNKLNLSISIIIIMPNLPYKKN